MQTLAVSTLWGVTPATVVLVLCTVAADRDVEVGHCTVLQKNDSIRGGGINDFMLEEL
jgi:hypothetical protein